MEKEVEKFFHSGADKIEKGLYEESIVDFLQALSINPNQVVSISQISYSHSHLKKYKEAHNYSSRVVEIIPE